MNPLSPLTYYLRHKRNAFLLIGLLCWATMGLYVMVAVLDTIPARGQFVYLTKVSRVYPAVGNELEPGVVPQIETHPDVARVIRDNGLPLSPPTLIGTDKFRLMGVSKEDAQYLMAHCGVRLKEGRLFEPRSNEIVLSEETARALGVKIGSQVSRSVNDRYYASVPTPLVVVGILEGDPFLNPGPSVRVGFASREYLESHELFAPRVNSLLIIAREGRKEAVEEFLEKAITSARTEAETFRQESRYIAMARVLFYAIFGIVNCMVAAIVALVVGVINRIAMIERVEEMGLLYAVGYQKNRLIGRLTLETAVVAALGWIAGIGLSLFLLYWLKSSLYYSKGMELDLANLTPFWFILPAPLVVIAFANISARRMLGRLDAVAIVERGKLSMEREGKRQGAKKSSANPLSSWTFYVRHRRRGIMLVVSMALMILGVVFPVFFMSTSFDALKPGYAYLRHVSQVSPARSGAIDPGIVAQIKAHPAVAHIITTMPLGLQALVPPGSGAQVYLYGAAEDDLPVLMALFDLQLVEGRLPRPRSNEIVLSRVLALNRGLHVGDKMGGLDKKNEESNPLIEDDMPVEMEIVGLLSRDELWLGFASQEYLASHELTASRQPWLLVVPTEGRKAELDAWLEQNIASAQVRVDTYAAQLGTFQQAARGVFVLFALVEFILAAVAAIALAILNYIFFAQRREEFGILHAVGRSRLWLIFRAVKETGSAVGIAWLFSAGVCLMGLIALQTLIYAPLGLSLDGSNLSPWLFTLPIPLAVVLVGGGTIARMLSKLDPVSIIERR